MRWSFVSGLVSAKPRCVTSSVFWNSTLAFASTCGVWSRAFLGCSPTTRNSAPASCLTPTTRGSGERNPVAMNSVTLFQRGAPPKSCTPSESKNSREERYANAFGRAFLMPMRTVMQRFREITVGASRLTRRHIILLAHAFGVSREATVRRLEELALTKPGTWDWFVANGGITDAQARKVLGDLTPIDTTRLEADRPTTLRLHLLAAEAWRQNLLSEGQLARLLRLDRPEVREILDHAEIEGSEADGMPKLLA